MLRDLDQPRLKTLFLKNANSFAFLTTSSIKNKIKIKLYMNCILVDTADVYNKLIQN